MSPVVCKLPFIKASSASAQWLNSNSNILKSPSKQKGWMQQPAWSCQRAVCCYERDIGLIFCIKTYKCNMILKLHILWCIMFEEHTVGLTSKVNPDLNPRRGWGSPPRGLCQGLRPVIPAAGLGGPYLLPGHHGLDALLSVLLIGSAEPEGSVEGFDEERSGIGFWQGRI